MEENPQSNTDNRLEFYKELKKHHYDSLKEESEIPEEYMEYSLEKFQDQDQISRKYAKARIINYIQNIDDELEKGMGIYLYGERNSFLGMTLLGTFVLRAVLQKLRPCYYREFSSFVSDMSSFDPDFYPYYNSDILLLDSIDPLKSLKSPLIHDNFSNVISYRRAKKLPIIFCSYVTPDVLSLAYCQSIQGYVSKFCYQIDLVPEQRKKFFTINEAISILRDFGIQTRCSNQTFTCDEISNILRKRLEKSAPEEESFKITEINKILKDSGSKTLKPTEVMNLLRSKK